MLAEADTVTDILAVQDRITAVQIQIEQVQGQQKLLEDQTAFGTLAITLGEPGAEIIEAESPAMGASGVRGTMPAAGSATASRRSCPGRGLRSWPSPSSSCAAPVPLRVGDDAPPSRLNPSG